MLRMNNAPATCNRLMSQLSELMRRPDPETTLTLTASSFHWIGNYCFSSGKRAPLSTNLRQRIDKAVTRRYCTRTVECFLEGVALTITHYTH